MDNYESAREELEEEKEDELRKKKKVVIGDEEDEDEVVEDSQAGFEFCYETDVSDELNESFDTDIDRTPMKQIEVTREHTREIRDLEKVPPFIFTKNYLNFRAGVPKKCLKKSRKS